MTLISAPAGFGKTTLISEWIAKCPLPVAWLSLDEGDGEFTRFLTYLIAALQTLAVGEDKGSHASLGKQALELLDASQESPSRSILTALVNDIATLPGVFVLVLDDYHATDARAIDEALAFLLEHLPSQMRLVITTREDPHLPLARLRARGQLTELRADDLRFTPAEADAFLNQVMGLALSPEDVAALEGRTEGWIAGLQLAALSMRGREDRHGFIKAFAGDHRYVVDYLVDEVLQRQPERVRNFLLQTSILARLCGPLCAALTGQDEDNMLLEELERSNLFVIPLDDRRQWYRYHHLFADVLRAHLLREQPDRVAGLHQRASAWYEQNDQPADAIRHALTAEDFERAAGLIEQNWAAMDRNRQSATWLRWAGALPDKFVRARPVLSVGYAWALLDSGELEAASDRLGYAERCLDALANGSCSPEVPATEIVIVDEAEFHALPATMATARAYIALAHDDALGAVSHARQALDFLPEADHLRRGIAGSLLGLAYWIHADLEAAHQAFAGARASFRAAGNDLFAITGTYVLADIRMAQGRLRDAINTYEQALHFAVSGREFVLRGTADLYLGLSELYREIGNLEDATQHLLQSEELSERAALPRWRYRWCLAQARIKEAEGDLDSALAWFGEAEGLYIRGPVPDIRPIAALKAQVWIAQGQLPRAMSWAHERGLTVADEPSYLREFEHMTLVRLLVARYASEQAESLMRDALKLLERLLEAASAGGRTGSVIEILALQARVHEAHGDTAVALATLERALTLAKPQGYVRLFVSEGAAMAKLLSAAVDRGIMPGYGTRLLAAYRAAGAGQTTRPPISSTPPLTEPLSERELEILQLVAQGLSNREIGDRLFLALSTVKGHNRNIYSKLAVQRRTEAVARARELGLL